jgi:uncharacterized protein (TIGR03086 family)
LPWPCSTSAACAHPYPAARSPDHAHGSSTRAGNPPGDGSDGPGYVLPVIGSAGASLRSVELIDAASAEFERVVRQLPADSWEWPTPSEVSVRELIEHVVVGNRLTALLLAGVDRDEARTMLTGDQLGDDPVTAVVESARRQAQAFAATPPGQPVAGPNGNVPAALYLRFRLVDLVVHAWDLLRAARLYETVDPQIVVGLLKVVEPHLDDMLAFGAYGAGPSGTLPADASPQSRLLDWFGRRP